MASSLATALPFRWTFLHLDTATSRTLERFGLPSRDVQLVVTHHLRCRSFVRHPPRCRRSGTRGRCVLWTPPLGRTLHGDGQRLFRYLGGRYTVKTQGPTVIADPLRLSDSTVADHSLGPPRRIQLFTMRRVVVVPFIPISRRHRRTDRPSFNAAGTKRHAHWSSKKLQDAGVPARRLRRRPTKGRGPAVCL